jgi:hypothetical protein
MDHVSLLWQFVTSDINSSNHRRSEDTWQVRVFKSGENGNYVLHKKEHNDGV